MHDAIVKKLNEQAAHYTIHEHEDSRTFADAVDKLPFPPERMLKTIVFRLKSGGWVLAAWVLSNVVEVIKLITHDSADVDLRIGATFFGGILVLLMSWIMEEGGKIREEQELTI